MARVLRYHYPDMKGTTKDCMYRAVYLIIIINNYNIHAYRCVYCQTVDIVIMSISLSCHGPSSLITPINITNYVRLTYTNQEVFFNLEVS